MKSKYLDSLLLFTVLFCLDIVLMPSEIKSHGFAEHTLIKSADKGHCLLAQLCQSAHQRKKQKVISYSAIKDQFFTQKIAKGGKSRTNCHCILGFTQHRFQDIKCTPSQEFFSIKSNCWVPAYLLLEGDELLSLRGTVIVSYSEFVKSPLDVYIIEVAKTHTFCVGECDVVTHNIALPFTAYLGLTCAFGSGAAAGAAAGCLLGPITLIAGCCALGGLIGMTVKSCTSSGIPEYALTLFNSTKIESQRSMLLYDNNPQLVQHSSGCFEKLPEFNQPTMLITPAELPTKPCHTGGCEFPVSEWQAMPGCGDPRPITIEDIVGCTLPAVPLELPIIFTQEAQYGNIKSSGKQEEHPHGVYDGSAKHHQNSRGNISPAPANGQEALDNSVQIKETSPHRVGVSQSEIVILSQTSPGIFHGHVRTWDQLEAEGSSAAEIINALVSNGFLNRRGKIINGK